MKKVATCNRVDGAQIDENELSSLEEMIQEASRKEQANGAPGGFVNRDRDVRISDANPMSRQSLAKLVGEENDLLSDTPVFQQAKDTRE